MDTGKPTFDNMKDQIFIGIRHRLMFTIAYQFSITNSHYPLAF